MEKTCFSKCIEDISTPSIKVAEESCLHRCSSKYRESLQIGLESMKRIETQLREQPRTLNITHTSVE